MFRFALNEPTRLVGVVENPRACSRVLDAVPPTNAPAKIAEAPAPLVRVWPSVKLPLNKDPGPMVTQLTIWVPVVASVTEPPPVKLNGPVPEQLEQGPEVQLSVAFVSEKGPITELPCRAMVRVIPVPDDIVPDKVPVFPLPDQL